MAEEKDDWLEDIGDDEESSSELDQADIDSLLAGDELDQANIDALLAGAENGNSSPDAASSGGELDQTDIDSLFASAAAPAAADDPSGAEADDDNDEIDQSDIEALLSGASPADDNIPDVSPDQEEIDRLFSEIDSDEDEPDPFQAEEIDFQDVLDESGKEDSVLSTGNEFGDDEFNFDEDLDIPDIPDDEETAVFGSEEETLSSLSGVVASQAGPTNATGTGEPDTLSEAPSKPFKMPGIPVPSMLQERKNQALAAGFFVILLLIAVFLFPGDKESPQIAEQQQVQTQEPITAQPESAPQKPNSAPQVSDSEIQMESQGPLAIQLSAQDPEGDALQYEILSQPEHGTLKGQAPYLIYTPDDSRSENDIFQFRVGDGRDFSIPALVTILRKNEEKIAQTPVPEAPPKKIETLKPRKLMISAEDLSYNVIGTDDFFIDWETIWDKANYLPYTNQVAVEILSDHLQGKLEKISGSLHKYRAQKYEGGQETIRYRFKLGKLLSKTRIMTLNVDPGNPTPEIVLQPNAEFYKPGEQVLIDAASSRDEERETLVFTWTQLSGIPVQIEFLNKERSRISFIAPSSFSTVKDPGPLMRVTVTDKSGQKDVQDVKIVTRSRYKSALWGDVVVGSF